MWVDRKERFTTFERVQFQELTVIKGNGKREPFDRDKISKSIRIATRKRPIDTETIEKFISKIVRNLEGLEKVKFLHQQLENSLWMVCHH